MCSSTQNLGGPTVCRLQIYSMLRLNMHQTQYTICLKKNVFNLHVHTICTFREVQCKEKVGGFCCWIAS